MTRRVIGVMLAIGMLSLVACGTELESAESLTKDTEQKNSVIATTEESAAPFHIDYYQWNGDYDYYFYLQGFYFSADGSDDKMYIQPLIFTESKDDVGYPVIEQTGEVIELAIDNKTEFHIIDWHHSEALVEKSINKPAFGEVCALDDATYFLDYMKNDYGEMLSSYPLSLYLREDGYVERVMELWLP